MKKPQPPHIDICIATYKRPLLLEKLVESLVNQETGGFFTYSLIIIDNDPERSASETIKNIEKPPVLISYDCQLVKNISLTRNLAVKKSTGEFLAFIDDDEYACVDWLLKLYSCLTRYKVDCVQGPVISYFPGNTSKWVTRSDFLNRERYATGTPLFSGRTGNCLIKSEVVRQFEVPFDPGFGLTGGEDSSFFRSIVNLNHTIIWCDEAEVYEYVTPERATLKWLLQRSFRGGNIHIIQKNSQKNIATKIINLHFSLAKLLTVLAASPLCLIIGIFEIKFLIKSITKLTEYFGQIAAFWGVEYKQYK